MHLVVNDISNAYKFVFVFYQIYFYELWNLCAYIETKIFNHVFNFQFWNGKVSAVKNFFTSSFYANIVQLTPSLEFMRLEKNVVTKDS